MIEAIVSVVRYAAPVGLASLGESVGQKAGVLNIGLEGTMLASAFFAMWTTSMTGNPWIGFASGIGVALVIGLVQALFTLKMCADQVVVGTAVNLFSLGLTGTLYRMQYGTSGQLLSVAKIPRFGPELDLVLVFWLVAVIGLTYMVFRTNWGLLLRATGEYPNATVAAGQNPLLLRLHGIVVSSTFVGMAGGYLSVGIAGSFAENMTAGRGFVALAMVTFGRWKPFWVLLASLLIGYADSLQFELQAKNQGIPPQLFIALPYVVALAVLVFAGKGAAAPAALGQPFRKSV